VIGCVSARHVATHLVIAEATVHHHILHIYAKLGVSTRAAATLKALQHDLLGSAVPTPAE